MRRARAAMVDVLAATETEDQYYHQVLLIYSVLIMVSSARVASATALTYGECSPQVALMKTQQLSNCRMVLSLTEKPKLPRQTKMFQFFVSNKHIAYIRIICDFSKFDHYS
ncbi:hypothetical protein L1987_65832 [Smallanthus sonchifolius]|uniref:Uncharacterized protein n=1 Tax=Smallanthus sonchifolius TaxID=185202 RepID=A0ACB9BVK8_9ASTR|nr:hypothetical protein L1987_65832 [Smallanthus sonchifolius]